MWPGNSQSVQNVGQHLISLWLAEMLQRDNNDAYFGNLLQLMFFLFIFLRYRVTQSVRHFICAGTIREGIKCCLADFFRFR